MGFNEWKEELKQERHSGIALLRWQLFAIFALLVTAFLLISSMDTVRQAAIYQSYQPAFDGLANGSLKIVPDNAQCSWPLNVSYNGSWVPVPTASPAS